MADEKLGIGLAVELADFRKQMASLPGIGEKEARDMVRGIQRQLKLAEKAAGDSAKGMGKRLADGFSVATTAAGTLAAAALAAGAAYKALADDMHGTVRTIEDFSTRTGLSRDTLNGLRVAAEATGKQLDDVVPEDLAVRIMEAASGTGTGADAFKVLGVRATEANGTLRDGDAVFRDLVASLSSMEDRTLAAALADDLFSDAGTRLLGILGDGTKTLDQYTASAKSFGIDVGPAAVKASNDWFAATSSLKIAFDDTKSSVLNMTVAGQTASSWVANFALGWVYLKTAVTEGTDAAGKAAREFYTLTNQAQQNTSVTAEGAAAAKAAAGDWSALAATMPKAVEGLDAITTAARLAALGTKDTKDEAAELAKVQAALNAAGTEAADEARKIERQNEADFVAHKTKLHGDFRKEQDRLRDVAAQRDQEQRAKDLDSWLRLYDEIVAKSVEVASTIQGVFSPYADAISGVFDLTEQRAEQAKDKLSELVDHNQKLREKMQRTDDVADKARLRGLLDFGRASRKAAKEEYDQKKKQAVKAWYADQAAKLTQTAMAGGLAVAQAFAQLGPIAGGIAAGGVTLAIGTQAAMIASQQPPRFHTGGVVSRDSSMAADERDIRVKHGEPVLSQRDYGRLLDVLDRLDRTMARPSAGPEVRIEIDGKSIPVRSVTTGNAGRRRNPYAGR